ncbi:MAG TPA: GDSL-type esterase/lipase family protein [Thermoanaerobaculia bacterium]|nr:GDSL-type esterase/lipase family protein [Thermoanaerobaculia bacterium]
MRRFLFWYLPLAIGVIAACVFAYGFVSYLAGNRGQPVNFAGRPVVAAPAPSRILTPVILGDSLARGAGDERGLGISGRLDAELRTRGIRAARTTTLGVNGARTADLLRQLESANVQNILRSSNTVILSIGGNDLWGGTDWRGVNRAEAEARMGEVLSRIAAIVARVRAANPHARIFFIGLYNPFVSAPDGKLLSSLVNRWNARLLEQFGSDPDFTLVATADLFSHRDRLSVDRFHPGGDGYQLIAKRIAEGL